MRQVTIIPYVHLGTVIRYLQDVEIESDNVTTSLGIISNIDAFFKYLEQLKMSVTFRYAKKLKDFKEKILIDSYGDKEARIRLTEELHEIMKNIRDVFSAEADDVHVFEVREKRFEVEKLLNNPEQLFGYGVFSILPNLTQEDFRECGKCIVFECPTAAAFHMLRGTEGVIKSYYKEFFHKNPGKKTWGEMTADFFNKKTGKTPNKNLINQLKHIKDSFRNPTQHPEMLYDIDEAQDLLGVCIDVINKMAELIKVGHYKKLTSLVKKRGIMSHLKESSPKS